MSHELWFSGLARLRNIHPASCALLVVAALADDSVIEGGPLAHVMRLMTSTGFTICLLLYHASHSLSCMSY